MNELNVFFFAHNDPSALKSKPAYNHFVESEKKSKSKALFLDKVWPFSMLIRVRVFDKDSLASALCATNVEL